MFENSGKIIKVFGYIAFGTYTIGGIVEGHVLGALGSVLLGFLVAIIGPMVGWVSGVILYGIGTAIENSEYSTGYTRIMNNRLKYIIKELESNKQNHEVPSDNEQNKKTEPIVEDERVKPLAGSTNEKIKCPKCHLEQVSTRKKCWACGTKFLND